MTKALLVMVSCEDDAEAQRIGEKLLKDRLAACVQVIRQADSMFLWPPGKNRIDYAEEGLLLIKTLESRWEALEKTVKKLHSYENPEIIALPVAYATKDYLSWMTGELA